METTLQVAFIIWRETLPCSQILWAFLVHFRKSSPGFSFTDDTLWGAIHLRSQCCGSNCVGCYRHDTLVKVQYHNDFNEAQKEAPGLAQGSVKAIADACGRQWVDIFWLIDDRRRSTLNQQVFVSFCFNDFYLIWPHVLTFTYQQLNTTHDMNSPRQRLQSLHQRCDKLRCLALADLKCPCSVSIRRRFREYKIIQNQKHSKRLVILGYSWKASGFEFLF